MECKMEGFDRVQEDGGVGGNFTPITRVQVGVVGRG